MSAICRLERERLNNERMQFEREERHRREKEKKERERMERDRLEQEKRIAQLRYVVVISRNLQPVLYNLLQFGWILLLSCPSY